MKKTRIALCKMYGTNAEVPWPLRKVHGISTAKQGI